MKIVPTSFWRTRTLGQLFAAALIMALLFAVGAAWATVPVYIALMPRLLSSACFFGAPVILILWIGVVVLALVNEGLRGLWLLTTGLIVAPAGLVHLLVWYCILTDNCL
jgi:hypothetical protein